MVTITHTSFPSARHAAAFLNLVCRAVHQGMRYHVAVGRVSSRIFPPSSHAHKKENKSSDWSGRM